MSYHKLIYHIIFGTKNRQQTINFKHDRDLYAYIFGIIKSLNGHVYRINGMTDHIHILSSLPPDIALSDAVKKIKQSSSIWLKENVNFPHWQGWADGYAALSYAENDVATVRNYIISQKSHHRSVTFAEEYEAFVKSMGYDSLHVLDM